MFEYQLERGILLRSQRHSAITLLYKKGSRGDPGNYRPIALLCVDVKVLSKVLAYRLQRFLPKLIHQDQKAFVRGRSMHHHIRHLTDIQDLVTHRGEEAYATFSTLRKLMIESIGRTCFAFGKNGRWKKFHRLGSSFVQ